MFDPAVASYWCLIQLLVTGPLLHQGLSTEEIVIQ